jgi:hypothetical protein
MNENDEPPMTKFPIYALTITALAAPTAAYPTDFMFFDCPGKVQVSITFTAPHKVGLPPSGDPDSDWLTSVTIDGRGLDRLVKNRVTFREVTKFGYRRAYLNGKPCREKHPEQGQ